jgi:hypothetical protein
MKERSWTSLTRISSSPAQLLTFAGIQMRAVIGEEMAPILGSGKNIRVRSAHARGDLIVLRS